MQYLLPVTVLIVGSMLFRASFNKKLRQQTGTSLRSLQISGLAFFALGIYLFLNAAGILGPRP